MNAPARRLIWKVVAALLVVQLAALVVWLFSQSVPVAAVLAMLPILTVAHAVFGTLIGLMLTADEEEATAVPAVRAQPPPYPRPRAA
jgi:hypothetical protein